METVIQFLKVYGILLMCAGAVIVLTALVSGCIVRMKQLEKRVSDMEDALFVKLKEAQDQTKDDQKKQRRLINESIAGLSESMTRAILTINERNADAGKKS